MLAFLWCEQLSTRRWAHMSEQPLDDNSSLSLLLLKGFELTVFNQLKVV